jgi:heparosan-N-sulfate-glucuronate 5-epimerase
MTGTPSRRIMAFACALSLAALPLAAFAAAPSVPPEAAAVASLDVNLSAVQAMETSPSPEASPTPPPVGGPGYGTTLSDDTTDTTPSHYYVWCPGDHPDTVPYLAAVPKDSRGIVMNRYYWIRGAVYNPTTIAQWAISNYEYWLHTGDGRAKTEFLAHASWLKDRGMDQYGRFPYRWSYPGRGLRAPWYSCMAQGIGMSVLLRAYNETGDGSYLAAAQRALRPMTIRTTSGGTAWTYRSELWLEEYPDRTVSHVLNGSIFGMYGVYDLVRVTGDPTARSVFARATGTLASHLGAYERRGSILYQTSGTNYAFGYHYLHIRQLRSLGLITGDTRFTARADRWESSFRPYPQPHVRLDGRRFVALAYGARAYVKGTVSPLWRAARVTITANRPGEAPYALGSFMAKPKKPGAAVAFSYRSPLLRANTVLTFSVEGEPRSARALTCWVTPRVALRTAASRDASGTPVTLLAAVIGPAQSDGAVVFECLARGRWRTLARVGVTPGQAPRFTWRSRKGRYTLRARFTGGRLNSAAASGKIDVRLR